MMFAAAKRSVDAATSLGLTTRAHVIVVVVGVIGTGFVFRLLRRRQLRGKYTLIWIAVSIVLLFVSVFPGIIDSASRVLKIYNPPNTLFLIAIAFLGLMCVYYSYELSKLEERTRILAEELAILRGDMHATHDHVLSASSGGDLLETSQTTSESERTS